MSPYLTDFHIVRPPYAYSQEIILDWLTAAHTQAEATRHKETTATFNAEEFARHMHALLRRIGHAPRQGKIKTRGSWIADVGHTRWEEMEIFRLSDGKSPACMGEKTDIYGRAVDRVFEELYPTTESLPHDLLHVTCTGYLAPSGAQKVVAKRQARKTTVTHVYHMGCYAAVPALRIAQGLIGSNEKRADIVHTELCSLHLNPYVHTPEQLVIQSLFADGCIGYSVVEQPTSASLALLATQETTVPDSTDAMTWQPASWGMQMTLQKEVPLLIAGGLAAALDDLRTKAHLARSVLQEKAIFAVHPGGPKIIDTVAEQLSLAPAQCRHSYAVLEQYGNMSSATLPHIWEALLKDAQVPDGTLIVSFAFGPGLTIASTLMQKVNR